MNIMYNIKDRSLIYFIWGSQMKNKKFIILTLSLLLISCSSNKGNSSNNISINDSLINSDYQSSISSNTESSLENSSVNESENSSYEDSSSSSSSNSSSEVISEDVSSDINSEEYNEDGSKKLNPPTYRLSEVWSSEETKYDFTSSFPEGFSYIYGHKILTNPNFYASIPSWKVPFPNSSARGGFQTPLFTSDKKIEIRFYIGEIANSSKKVDEKNPFLKIYGFNQEGKLIRSYDFSSPSNFYSYRNSKNPLRYYINGENIDYLEFRFLSQPYKSSQCYNFGIKEIGFKMFPYALD